MDVLPNQSLRLPHRCCSESLQTSGGEPEVQANPRPLTQVQTPDSTPHFSTSAHLWTPAPAESSAKDEGPGFPFPEPTQAFQTDTSNGCRPCEFISIRDDKRAELFVPCGSILGRLPTSTILISLATWLWIYNTHHIPDSLSKRVGIPQCLSTKSRFEMEFSEDSMMFFPPKHFYCLSFFSGPSV